MMKRYVEEPESKVVRDIYLKAYSEELVLAFSSWDIGEALDAFDKASARGILSCEEYLASKSLLLLETRRLIRLGALTYPGKI
ncbi:MAG: hypothetical protein QXR65_06545 [Candidatus Bathyarchaeia archaeon]